MSKQYIIYGPDTLISDANPYTRIPNTILKSKELTATEKGIIAYILSNKPTFKIIKNDVFNHSGMGKHAFNTAWQKLIEKGYLVMESTKDEQGRFKETNYYLYVTPLTENPLVENPLVEIPLVENHTLITNNTNNNQNKITNKNNNKKIVSKDTIQKNVEPTLKASTKYYFSENNKYREHEEYIVLRYEDSYIGKLWKQYLVNIVKQGGIHMTTLVNLINDVESYAEQSPQLIEALIKYLWKGNSSGPFRQLKFVNWDDVGISPGVVKEYKRSTIPILEYVSYKEQEAKRQEAFEKRQKLKEQGLLQTF